MLKRTFIIAWRGFSILLVLALAAVIYFEYLDPSVRGWWLRHRILSAIDDAQTIQMVEHSCRFDSIAMRDDPNYHDVIYGTRTLTPSQVEELKKALPRALDFSGQMDKMCMFQDHHDLVLLQKDGSSRTLRLCFHCGQLIWNDHYQIMPEGWPSSLGTFAASLKLHPQGPWTDENGNATSPNSPDHR